MSWEMVKLGDVCSSIYDGDHNAPPKADSGVPFITISNLDEADGTIDFDDTKYVSEGYYDSLSAERRPQKDDVLYSVVGSFGIPSLVRGKRRFVFQRHIAILRPSDRIVPAYLYYVLKSPDFYHWADSVAVGAAQRTVTLGQLRNKTVALPPLDQQKRIADILSAYDKLIENSRRQIALLEEAAQRLYKEWFVDLRFPGYETTPIIDGLPEGWRTCSISDVCERIQSGSTPSRKHSAYWDKEEMRWFKTAELLDGYLFDSGEHISMEAVEQTAVKIFPAGSILMAIYASPTLGRLGILTEDSTFNQAALGFVPDSQVVTREWLFLKLKELREEFNSVARGAGQQNISGEIVKQYPIVVPPTKLILKFGTQVSPLFRAEKESQNTILIAREARDRLLPKLMSGEIEVG